MELPAVAQRIARMTQLNMRDITAPRHGLPDAAERLYGMIHIKPAADAHGIERILRVKLCALRAADVPHRSCR